MKKLLFIYALVLTMGSHAIAGWFDNGEKERRIEAEKQLQEERQANGDLVIVVIILATGCIGLLTIGAAIGSKVRRASKPQ